MKIGKRALISVILLNVILLLSGWGSKPVKLLDDKKLLIELDKAIENASLGKEGSSMTLQDEKAETEQENINEMEMNAKSEEVVTKKTYTITIQNETIKIENEVCESVEDLETFIRKNGKGAEIVIQDDYAEAHMYEEVRNRIHELQEEMNLTITEPVF